MEDWLNFFTNSKEKLEPLEEYIVRQFLAQDEEDILIIPAVSNKGKNYPLLEGLNP